MKSAILNLALPFAIISIFSACHNDADEPSPLSKIETADSSASGSFASSTPSGNSGGSVNPGPNAGVITAAEWNDLENWEFWENLINEQEYSEIQDIWEFYFDQRYSFQLVNEHGGPVVDANVGLYFENELMWETKSDNFGKAECWVNLNGTGSMQSSGNFKLRVNDQVVKNNLLSNQPEVEQIVLTGVPQVSNKVDIAFVVDATWSMGDELEFLKVELLDVIQEVKSSNPNIELNIGTVFYRDEGDEYVTRVSQLSSDILNTINFIQDQFAAGGGDYPEAVHTALNDAIAQLNWSVEARSRIIFLVLDAPPHQTPNIISEIRYNTGQAAKKGIKIIPITASGINKETEFLMRFMSIATNGTYVFITDDSGVGNDHLEPTVGEYEVEYLNDLMVRLIDKYALHNHSSYD